MIEVLAGIGVFMLGMFFGAVLYGAGVKAGEENGTKS